MSIANENLQRQQSLEKSGFITSAHVRQAQQEVLDLQIRQRNAERSITVVEREQKLAGADLAMAASQQESNIAQLERSLAELNQELLENDSRKELLSVAPYAGRVGAIPISVGQHVQGGQTLVTLVPRAARGSDGEELQAHLYGTSRAIGFAKIGQKVWLQYSSFPYQKFGMAVGEVVSLTNTPISAEDLPSGHAHAILAASKANEPMYRILVRLPSQSVSAYGKPVPLIAGMALSAEIRLDSRKVWEWMFEPLIAVLKSR